MPSFRSRIIQRIMRDTRDAFLGDMPVDVRRRRMDAAARRGIRIPRGVAVRTVSAGAVPCEWIEPDEVMSERVILYLHGGGYIICSLTTHRGMCARIARASGAHLLSVDYRLAPENPFPAALDDALTAYHHLLDAGHDPSHIVIGGDSAGGGLTLATALALRDRSDPLPAALFLLSPWTDLTFSGDSVRTRAERDPLLAIHDDWLTNAYAGSNPLTHPYISPLFADLTGLPPMHIQVGTEEILYDDSTRLLEAAHKAGVDAELETWPDMWHVFQAYAPYIPESQQAIDHIGEFVRERI